MSDEYLFGNDDDDDDELPPPDIRNYGRYTEMDFEVAEEEEEEEEEE